MQDSPLFSILIANYNNGRFLEESIRSVYSQTYTNWEIIIVDDCSTDESQDIYNTTLKDDLRIKIFYNSENRGCGYTKRRCIEEARGEICGFLDPDDALTKDALESMVKVHLENIKVGLVYSESYYCDENLNISPNEKKRHHQVRRGEYLTNTDYVVGAFATFKRTIYNETIGLNETYKRAVDQDLYYLLEEVADLLYIDNFLYLYRIHDNGISTGKDNTNNIKALSWHMTVIIDTCRRRNIEFERNVTERIRKYVLEPQREKCERQINDINNSFSYKIVRLITKTLYPLRRLL